MKATGVQTMNNMPHVITGDASGLYCACRSCVLSRFVAWFEDYLAEADLESFGV